jgi:hypothetical protein
MDKPVPERFSTPRADIDVVTRAARVPALLTAYRLRGADLKQIDLHLQTGLRTTDRQTLAGVAEGPFLTVSMEDPDDGDEILPALPDVQYFLHSYAISVVNATVADDAEGVGIFWFSDPTHSHYLRVNTPPLVPGSWNLAGVLDVLTCPNKTVEVYFYNGEPYSSIITLTYAVVSGVM